MPYSINISGRNLVITPDDTGEYKTAEQVRDGIGRRLKVLVIDIVLIGGEDGKALTLDEFINFDDLESLLFNIDDYQIKSNIETLKKKAESNLKRSTFAKEIRQSKQAKEVDERKNEQKSWFYSKDGVSQSEAMSSNEITRLVKERKLLQSHLLWKDGFDEWKRVSDVPEFCVNQKESKPSNKIITEQEDNDNNFPITSTGTGWLCGPGVIATNYHVISNSKLVSVDIDGKEWPAVVLVEDRVNDLALIKVDGFLHKKKILPISKNQSKTGSSVFTIGFPHSDVMGVKPKLTSGVISAVSGIQDDRRLYQVTVPVQPGNSGGPLIDCYGYVVGVVTSKLSASMIYERSGDIPENVNYAVKSAYLAVLLEAENIKFDDISLYPEEEKLENITEAYTPSVFLVLGRG